MKNTGKTIRLLAIIAFVLMFVVSIADYVLSSVELQDNVESLEERIEDHEDDHKDSDYWGDEDDCSTCKSYEDSRKSYERYATKLILEAAKSVLMSFVYCGIMFAVGAIISKPADQNVPVQQNVSVPATPYCHSCGNKLQPGTRFCPVCGTEN